MNITYDPETDTMTLVFSSKPVAESDEGKPNIIMDYDADGYIVAMEILDASHQMADVRHVDFKVA
ncbi:MAG: DUF2283 domain-containing protein [Alphaproteobacteria bacterium]|nr:DUF2283 domain-containing protein [Alphaproteobacteria bacterium]